MDIIAECIKRIDSKFINALETGTIRSYKEKDKSTKWLGESIKNGKIISIDINPKSIEISKNIFKNLKNIVWIQGDSLDVLKKQQENHFDFILLDSVNNKDHIFEEFKLALKLIKINGIIMIDDFGINLNGSRGDKYNPLAVKGVKVYDELKKNNLLKHLKLYRGKKGVQGFCIFIKKELKEFNF